MVLGCRLPNLDHLAHPCHHLSIVNLHLSLPPLKTVQISGIKASSPKENGKVLNAWIILNPWPLCEPRSFLVCRICLLSGNAQLGDINSIRPGFQIHLLKIRLHKIQQDSQTHRWIPQHNYDAIHGYRTFLSLNYRHLHVWSQITVWSKGFIFEELTLWRWRWKFQEVLDDCI